MRERGVERRGEGGKERRRGMIRGERREDEGEGWQTG